LHDVHADSQIVKHEMLHDILDDGRHYQAAWDDCDLRRSRGDQLVPAHIGRY
jgi:hypothetical protein